MVPQARLELARLSALVSKTSVATITPPGQNKYYMEKIYVQDLYDMVRKLPEFIPNKSYSIIRVFKPTFPKKPKPEFKPDWTGASGKS